MYIYPGTLDTIIILFTWQQFTLKKENNISAVKYLQYKEPFSVCDIIIILQLPYPINQHNSVKKKKTINIFSLTVLPNQIIYEQIGVL